ncbi:hypothetical protein BKA69DRAFT_1057949 [Paraphysoderma sedebokerense]|nr:hypothetical protein BKA69DRAFT_1057949 [Paraphysoderma sedebokerense]
MLVFGDWNYLILSFPNACCIYQRYYYSSPPSCIVTSVCTNIYRTVHLNSTQYDTYRLAAFYTFYGWIIIIFCGTSAAISFFVLRTKSKLSKPTGLGVRLFRIIPILICVNFILLFSAIISDSVLTDNPQLYGITFILIRAWFGGELILHNYVRQLSRLNSGMTSSVNLNYCED